MDKKDNILREDFTSRAVIVPGYEGFMQGLMNIVHSGPLCDVVGERNTLGSYRDVLEEREPDGYSLASAVCRVHVCRRGISGGSVRASRGWDQVGLQDGCE